MELVAEVEVLHREAGGLRGEVAQPVVERDGVRTEVDEQQSPPGRDRHREESEVVAVERVVAEVAGVRQRAVERVGPAVVAAHEARAAAAAVVDERPARWRQTLWKPRSSPASSRTTTSG